MGLFTRRSNPTEEEQTLMDEFKQRGVNTNYNARRRDEIKAELAEQDIKLWQEEGRQGRIVWIVGKKRIPAYDE